MWVLLAAGDLGGGAAEHRKGGREMNDEMRSNYKYTSGLLEELGKLPEHSDC